MDLQNLLEIAVRASVDAGKKIMEVYGSDFNVEYKSDSSPLTVADKEANNIINGYLSDTGIPVLSEEGKQIPFNERSKWPVFWMVDPLDGTKEFVKRNGEFTVNIALIEKNTPVIGVIYAPALDVLYFGMNETGSMVLNNVTEMLKSIDTDSSYIQRVLSLSKSMPLTKQDRNFTAVASRSHLSTETESFIDSLRKQHGEVAFISSGSSLKICLVAEGVADIYPRLAPTMEWDTAAGQAIAEFSGCTVTRYDNNEQVVYNKEDLLNPFFIVSRN
jgi:3'(2'), 5'-bisphosphate nucleotidase